MMQRWLAATILAITFASAMGAQTLGGIVGEVKDASGAMMPAAKVTATNVETNVARETATNSSGLHTFPSLAPGLYTIKVDAPGFQTMQRANVEIQVQQTARVDFTLSVGQASQTIEVSAAAAQLSTDDATVGAVIEQRRCSAVWSRMLTTR
jgi:hypothetical protein